MLADGKLLASLVVYQLKMYGLRIDVLTPAGLSMVNQIHLAGHQAAVGNAKP